MHLDHIDLSKLVISPANMRAKHKDRDSAELIPSIRARGVLVPLLVRPSTEPDKYEIVAGRRRYFAAKAVAEADGGSLALPCAIMDASDDAGALEASIIENFARLDADEVTLWETFARLVKKGRTAEEIAATFGIAERAVRRILALGNLLPRIRTLYRADQIDAATVRHLTLATAAQQRAWLELVDDPDRHAPTGRLLKDWLFGGEAIQTTAALFDLSDYAAPIVGDLFEDHGYFSDASQFWILQTQAIEATRQSYLDLGWLEVILLEPGDRFAAWDYDKRSRSKGGRVYIAVHENGTVDVHEGYVPRKEAERAARTDDSRPPSDRPELSAPLKRYVDLHRHALARTQLLDHPWVAMRLLVAHAIFGSPLWSVQCERQKADKADTEQSVRSSSSQARFDVKRREALSLIGFAPETPTLVESRLSPCPAVFESLLALSDDDVLQIAAIVIGETIDAGGDAIDAVGILLRIEPEGHWQADEAFFSLLRDRRAVLSLVSEIAGEHVAHANAGAAVKVLKSILRDYLEGVNGRTKVEGWAPRWLRFPRGSYDGSEVAKAETSGPPASEPSET